MTTSGGTPADLGVADPRQPVPPRFLAASSRVIAGQTSRRALRSGLLWGAVLGGYIALQASSYVAAYKTTAERARFASTFSSGGLIALTGPAREIGTVAGFTAWKCLGILTVIGAMWGLLTSTRLLRGEEEAGRWELLLAGHTTPRRGCIQAVAGLFVGLAAMFGMTALLTAGVGQRTDVGIAPSAALFFAVAVVSSAALFLAGGALASQLMATRRQAAAAAGAVFGASFAMRMVADSSHRLAWLRDATPLGWIEQLRPLTGSRPLFLIPIAGLSVVLAASAAYLSGTRDVGASVLPDRQTSRPHTRLLSGPVGLEIRLTRMSTIAWFVGLAATSALLSAIANKDVADLKDTASARRTLVRLGGHGDFLKIYLAVSFLIIGIIIMLIAAGQLAGIRREEADGRAEHLLVGAISRQRWLVGRLLVAVAVVVLGGIVAGASAWLGLIGQQTGVRFGSLVGAGLSASVAALVLLGVGLLAFGIIPRAATACGFAILAWSFLVELLGGVAGASHWLLDTSLLHQTLAAPARPPDLVALEALIAIGVGAAVAGIVAFTRRDITGE